MDIDCPLSSSVVSVNTEFLHNNKLQETKRKRPVSSPAAVYLSLSQQSLRGLEVRKEFLWLEDNGPSGGDGFG